MKTTSRKWILAAVALALILSFAAWRISKARCFQLVGEVTCRFETKEKIVALSFDDGPTEIGVDAVLAELEPRGIKATFFLIGKHMERSPGLAKRLADAGHEVGNHSFSHTPMLFKLPSTYDRELLTTDRMLKAEGITNPVLFRPPFGKRLIGLPMAVERAGYRTIMWDVADDADNHPDPRDYADHILKLVRPGSIILIHPMYRHRQSQTAREGLPLILDALKAKGYRVVPVGELLKLQGKG